MLVWNVWNVYLHRTYIVKGAVLSVSHLGSFLGFLGGWKRESHSSYICIWEFKGAFQCLCLSFFQFFICYLIFFWCTPWLQKWHIRTLLLRSLGHFISVCLSWLIFLFSKPASQSTLICFAKCWYKTWPWARLLERLDAKWKEKKKQKGIFSHFLLQLSPFCVSGTARVMCLGLLTEISCPNFVENDIGWPAQNVW